MEDTEETTMDYRELPEGFRLIEKVDGGGDCMPEAILLAMNQKFDVEEMDIPSS